MHWQFLPRDESLAQFPSVSPTPHLYSDSLFEEFSYMPAALESQPEPRFIMKYILVKVYNNQQSQYEQSCNIASKH